MQPMSHSGAEVLATLTPTDTVGKYFDTVFDDNICDLIVMQTNLYRKIRSEHRKANQLMESQSLMKISELGSAWCY